MHPLQSMYIRNTIYEIDHLGKSYFSLKIYIIRIYIIIELNRLRGSFGKLYL